MEKFGKDIYSAPMTVQNRHEDMDWTADSSPYA